VGSDTITLNSGDTTELGPMTVTIGGSTGTIASSHLSPTFTYDTSQTIDTGTITSTHTINGIEYDNIYDNKNNWPSEYQIKSMIEHYPALKLQYERFKELFDLVKDDWKANHND
jgi:hypothetical protein